MFNLRIVEDRVHEASKRQKLREESGLNINKNSWEARKEYAKVLVRRLSDHINKDINDLETVAPNLDKLTTTSVSMLEEGLKVYVAYCESMAGREFDLSNVAVELETEDDAERKRTIKACKASLDSRIKDYKKEIAKISKSLVYEAAFEEAKLIYDAVEEIFMDSGIQGEAKVKDCMYDDAVASLMNDVNICANVEILASKQISVDKRMEDAENNSFSGYLCELPKDYEF